MQQVGGAVVAHRILAPLFNHAGLHYIANPQVTFAHLSIMDDQTFERTLRILDMKHAYRAGNIALITYLPTTLSIEGRHIEYQQCSLWRTDALDFHAVNNQAGYFAATADSLVARELTWPHALKQVRQGLLILPLDKNVR